MVLILTNPSLPAANQMLSKFSNLPYYRVNFSKSLILDLGVHKLTRQHLMIYMLFSWMDKVIPYLGTMLTPSRTILAEANFKPLTEDIRK